MYTGVQHFFNYQVPFGSNLYTVVQLLLHHQLTLSGRLTYFIMSVYNTKKTMI